MHKFAVKFEVSVADSDLLSLAEGGVEASELEHFIACQYYLDGGELTGIVYVHRVFANGDLILSSDAKMGQGLGLVHTVEYELTVTRIAL